ncbi:MAG: ABC transporter ATP-binding protein [Ignavibacteriae bacterium]|nr:ABC transporter ATP-binding protein [Ignavibacteriota bacterium]
MIGLQGSDSESLRLTAQEITKSYNLQPVLTGVSLQLNRGNCLGITGRNGAGKSTLLKILANVLESSSGSLSWELRGLNLKEEALPKHLGYVAPYLELYTEFSIIELLNLLGEMRQERPDMDYALNLVDRFKLRERVNDRVDSFSSGMRQRVKYIIALAHHPSFLMLDEPMSNLDEDGQRVVREIVTTERSERITIVATNDADDLEMCTHRLRLEGG